jgi:formylglycine-generating enzyme required for sulfatase activity
VTLTRGFFIDRSEVTVRAYQACVAQRLCSAADQVAVTPEQPAGEDGSQAPPPGAGSKELERFVDTWSRRCNAPRGETNHPVNCVDYGNAESYCRFRGRRLPTEAEWEVAARGLSQRAYAWGVEAPGCDRACYDRNGECRPSGAEVATCAAGSHPGDRTPEGVYDLAGNLSEWVADGLVHPPPGGVDPRGDPAAPLRVVRGGSFYDGPEKLVATFRNGVAPVTAHATIGFRCAMDSGESPAIDAGAGRAGAE